MRLCLSILCLLAVGQIAAAEPVRKLMVVTSAIVPAEIKAAAASVVSGAKSHPLLGVFAEGKPVELVDSEKLLAAPMVDRAYSHLILIGLMDDPMIQQAWQREARRTEQGVYVFGFGFFAGDIGYTESDRNPFLHSEEIKVAPFETEVVTITGTTPAGVVAAVRAFMEQGIVNGVVAGDKWTRPTTSLLDRDPLSKDYAVPPILPSQIGGTVRIGITQASEDEYRGVLQDTQLNPAEIIRAKYYVPGAWDGKGWQAAMKAYHTGLHRRATGNTLWAARFASEEEARQAAPKIAAAAELKPTKSGDRFIGQQPPFAANDSPGQLVLWRKGEWVLMSTLPKEATDRIIADQSRP